MKHGEIRKLTGIFLACLIAIFSAVAPFRTFPSFPEHLRLIEGQEKTLQLGFPFKLAVETDKADIVKLNGKKFSEQYMEVSTQRPIKIRPVNKGEAYLDFKLLGLIPVHRMVVEVLPQIKVIPGGQSIGVLLHSEGAMIVGQAPIFCGNGERRYPAKEAGINTGDVILEVDGKPADTEEDVAEIINFDGERNREIVLKIERNGKILKKSVRPIYCADTNRYRIGLYIRDNISGVGTLTFYDPATQRYGALGHMITDADTNRPIKVKDGKIVNATISTVRASQRSQPGEKIGIFESKGDIAGDIEENTEFGIFGKLDPNALKEPMMNPMPIAIIDQLHEGPATMLTVIEGNKIQAFNINIERIFAQRALTTKSMIIKVTDKRLIAKTGGIVQGMSGSPIIQDGRLAGAVTHVFINDPLHGYAVLAERMFYESNNEKPSFSTEKEERAVI